MTELNWNRLGFERALLREAVSALTGARFPSRPPEWNDYFDDFAFEDENQSCLEDPETWHLVAGRALPLASPPDKPVPQLALTFQPFCSRSSKAADTSLQLIFTSSAHEWSNELMALVRVALATPATRSHPEDAGFTSFEKLSHRHDRPYLVARGEGDALAKKVKRLRSSGYRVTSVQWMASVRGQLDWIFGRLERVNASPGLRPTPLILVAADGQKIFDLGFYDFLPMILREPYRRLNKTAQLALAPFHVAEDLHTDAKAAQRVFEIDMRVSDPQVTHHQRTNCIQCHAAQERLERAREYLQNGGAKEFGYFFRGLGLIDDQPYMSWRSIQENRFYDRKLKEALLVR